MEKKDDNLPSETNPLLAAIAYVAVGILSTVILVVGTRAIEHTPQGQGGEFWAFGFLQGALSNFDPKNPVVLIDIGKVSENSQKLVPVLKETVEALKALHKRPIAIAVDVDFSPIGALSNDATEFFDACLKKDADDVPVYLGVSDNKSALPEEWLGLEKYKELAAAVAINKKDTRWIPIWVQANEGEKLRTLNYSLAQAYGSLPRPASWIAGAVETSKGGEAVTRERSEVDPNEVTLTYADRLVNYSKLETMRSSAKTVTNEQDAKTISNDSESYSGKLVIIGDVNSAEDNFPIPGPREDKPGSLLLASSTYTLIKEPLFEFKSNVKLALDLFIAGIIVLLVAFIRYLHPSDLSWKGRQAVFIYGAIAIVVITGFLLVRFAQVIWPDFLFVLFALLLHPKVERVLHPILEPLGEIIERKLKSLKRSTPPATGPVGSAMILVWSMTLIMTASVHAQQRPEDLCQRGIGAVALELTSPSKSKKKKKEDTCQYCDSDNDDWRDLTQADTWKQFRPGQRLRCSEGCTLVIHVCGNGRKQSITYIAGKPTPGEGKTTPGWYTVINPYRIPRKIVDPNPEAPAKKMEWSSLAPANPDPRPLEVLRDSSSEAVSFYAAAKLDESIKLSKAEKVTAGIPQPSPSLERSRSKPVAPTSSAVAMAPAGTPTVTPPAGETIARVSSPSTAAPSATPSATPTAATAAATATATPSASARAARAASAGTTEPTATEGEERQLLEKFASLITEGNAARDAKNYAAAEKAYSQATSLRASDPRPWYGLGNVYLDQKKWTEAEGAYRVSALLGIHSPDVYLGLATLLINSQTEAVSVNRMSEAERYLWAAAQLEPKNEKVYRLLEVVLKKRGAKPDELKSAYRRALSLNPASVTMNLRLGTLLYPAQPKEAKKHFRIAEKAARTPEELLDVATALESRNKLDRAERFVQRALKLDPANARANTIRGLVLIDREEYSAALPWLQDAIKHNQDNFVPRYLSAIAYLQTGNLDQSEHLFDEARTRVSSEKESYATAYWLTVLGDAYIQKGRKPDAVRAFERALEHNPDDLNTRDKLSKIRSSLQP